jgi:C-terminal processing protease CtpA/Prc
LSSGSRGARAALFVPGVLIGLLAGLILARAELVPFAAERESLSDEVERVITEKYFRDPKQRALRNASAEGMVRQLRRRYDDRFSHYFDPQTLDEFKAATKGQFSGVGMAVSEVKRGPPPRRGRPGSTVAT